MALTAVKQVPTNAQVPEYLLYIDGEWRRSAGGQFADDFNPATGATFARVAQGNREDATSAVDAAFRARAAWAGMIVSERAAILLRAADVLSARIDEIRDVLIEESGSTFGKAMFEV